MRTWCVAVLGALSVFNPCLAKADALQEGLDTMWEVLWHQSGTPTRLVRWDRRDLQVNVHGVNAAVHRQGTLQALRNVAAVAGLTVTDVSDRADAASVANVDIEIVPDQALQAMEPCVTMLNFRTEDRIDSVQMKMRNGDAGRCVYHESMHVMGLRGHPEGRTVLSYFNSDTQGLLPLDKAMLRAWYSPRTRGGMTPFEVLPVLADELVATMPDRAAATRVRDAFLKRTVDQMRAFADGTGDIPTIVKRSGKSTELGIRFGRMEMSYFLGVAYLQGATVKKDPSDASRWLERAASMGSRNATVQLGAAAAG